MSALELLELVLNNPEYIADSYYNEFATAVNNRYVVLRRRNNDEE